jgi:uncharacterized protein
MPEGPGRPSVPRKVAEPPLIFLDANILFSAAIGGPAFQLLLDLARAHTLRLVTSESCVLEAETNLERKRAPALNNLTSVLALVVVFPGAGDDEHVEWASSLVHPDDIHVLAAARRVGADVLLTGDTTHFSELMKREDLDLRIRTLRSFLLATPEPELEGA